MNDIYSFYQLISKYQIEIPIIQRDYAQGRDNAKAADVRKSLVTKMISAVNNSESLFFDFVYGRVDDNKFIPFDGQQRLTTLFLFHKYVFEKCQSESNCSHKGNCICKDILNRFSYATRQSSREFCEQLVKNSIIPNDDYKKQLRKTFIDALKDDDKKKEEKANEYIKPIIYRFVTNQSWFYPDWQKDPTVLGMLTMLDEIHCQMNNETDFKAFAERLTSGCNCPITFHFVDMGEHKMSDETYVKMNARGKMLTPFENFKASLEQYLEDKKENKLAERLKAGIDGSWLDLFWRIANEGEMEKELPDTLMMSFFNRHFMNVWRCWYANNSKSEKEREKLSEDEKNKQKEWDCFNDRIQKEMPLYPTKDNFVSFEIYSYVMENCGVDDCLTPIFNICDELCKNDNCVANDCQAVWNREEREQKWNLYQGDKNKDTRETYPSRVAFYALMKYFATDTDTTSLSQWMRVVWNIIENSTIDSKETYHAALRLIEKLSIKSHSINNALSNEFGLGNQYHAKEQLAEEIAKAKQIINGGNEWESKIIDAEKYAFFKGAIRFLFTDENGKVTDNSWEQFDTKWGNAKRYFKEKIEQNKSAMNNDFDNAKLLKALISWFKPEDFWSVLNWSHRVFNNNSTTWQYYLLNTNIHNPIHEIMMGETKIQQKDDCPSDEAQHRLWQLSNTYLLDYVIEKIPNSWIRVYHGHKAIFPSAEGIFLNADLRNNILINTTGIELEENNIVPNSKFLFGTNINFKYNGNLFQWYNDDTIYLMENNWNYKKRLSYEEGKTNKDNYYCFRVTPEMETDTSLFTKGLEKLIEEAE